MFTVQDEIWLFCIKRGHQVSITSPGASEYLYSSVPTGQATPEISGLLLAVYVAASNSDSAPMRPTLGERT